MAFSSVLVDVCSRPQFRSLAVCRARGFGPAPNCPCGNKKKYEDCCGAIHTGHRKAEKAEEIMRARYVAYQRGLANFIMETTEGAKEREDAEKWKAALKAYMDTTKFKGLKILKTELGDPGDPEGYVRFEVTANNRTYVERSHFLPNPKFGWIYEAEKVD